MPKRDDAYMERQRSTIARGALEVLLQKGLYATSLRDICRSADVSMGAVYSYFETKNDVVVAACSIDHFEEENAVAQNWNDYLNLFFPDKRPARDSYYFKRQRLSLQLVAELAVMENDPHGLSAIYDKYRARISHSLTALSDAGLISMPFGLERTAEMHMQLFAGAAYQVAAHAELDFDLTVTSLSQALAITAGRVNIEAGGER